MTMFYDVSVVVIHRQRDILLERCVRSCLAQTMPGQYSEVVIVGHGNDLVQEILSGYEGYVKSLLSDHPVTLIESLRLGTKHATGRYILLVDSNDFISDYMLLFQTVFLYDNHDCDGVAVDYWYVDPESDRKIKRVSALEQPLLFGVMWRKEVFLREGVYDPEFGHFDEETLYRTLTDHSNIGHLSLSFYRRCKN